MAFKGQVSQADIKIDPFIKRLINEIVKLVRNTGAPARTIALAMTTHIPESTIRYWLRKAEDSGLIQRRGMRGGWLPVPDVVAPRRTFQPAQGFTYLHA